MRFRSNSSLPLLAACLVGAPAFAQDTDLDGVLNPNDAFPCDVTVSAESFAPGEDTYGMMLIEDQWPAESDLDANDQALAYNYALRHAADGRVVSLRLNLSVLAIGGTFNNGVALHLPVDKSLVQSVKLSTLGGPQVTLAPSVQDTELTVLLQSNLRNLFGGQQRQINSRIDLAGMPAAQMHVDVVFSSPVDLLASDAPYDLYLRRTSDAGHQIHLPKFSGSAAMNANLFGGQFDGSAPGRRFVDQQGIPAVLLLPEATMYPSEGKPISALFPNITLFASSGGVEAQDFYTSQVVTTAGFVDVNGLGAPSPVAVVAVPVDNTCLTLADFDGDGFIAANDCDDANAAVFPGNPEVCDGLDNDCNTQVDDGISGIFATYYLDADGDGYGDGANSISACGLPPGYVPAHGGCTNGSLADCNVPGSTLIPTSVFVDPNPPAGWRQCAGFVNTNGDDISPNFLDNCLGASGLRIRVTNLTSNQIEEDITATGLGAHSSWPNWNYLGGSATTVTRTYWGSTTFFTTTDGRDACGQSSASNGTTFGTGNGSVAIVAGGNTNGSEYRLSCGGAALPNRRVAIYVQDGSQQTIQLDCDDASAARFPTNTEICDTIDNNCDGAIDEGLARTYYQDQDGDGFGDQGVSVSTCNPPANYVLGGALCANGSSIDCNVPGTTLIPTSAYVDSTPPTGWIQCAGFENTAGDDVQPNFFDNCLGQTSLRLKVINQATGQIEEDVYASGLTSQSSWPNWNYLGGSLTTVTRTNWGSTPFFTTTDGRDACGQSSASNGNTFGTGNGSVAIVAGGNTNAAEYRISCGGAALAGRLVAIYHPSGSGQSSNAFDCNDGDASVSPTSSEICNGVDDNCAGGIDEGNPQSGVSCSTGLTGQCAGGTTQCTAGTLLCQAVNAASVEVCGDSVDNNCDGAVDELMCVSVLCSNGSGGDCNVSGTSLIPSSRYVDYNPPSGWTQCAGFINTSGDDVAPNFLDNCLGSNRMRIIVTNIGSGQIEEDISATSLNSWSSWPNWNYLGGSATAHTRTYWGSTTFFTTTDGRDACGQSSASNGTTLGTGNGSVAIVAGGNTNALEYRRSCGGAALNDRRIAIYR